VPKKLFEEHKKKRDASALIFLTRYSEQGDVFFRQIVIGDETCVSHLTPKSKRAVHGVEAHLITEKAQIQTISTHKIMCTVFGTGEEFCLLNSCLKEQP
jgi:hypothetical protein